MDIFEKRIANPGNIGRHSDNSHGYFTFPKLEGEIGPHMEFRGKTLLNWSLNNYLGLANHPEVRRADADAAAKYGLALPMGARMMSGNSDLHEQLERELATFVGKEDSILLNYGYQGIMSVIDALVDRHDIIVYDAESHACIIDGLRMHLGQTYKYVHNNMESLEKNLQRAERKLQEMGGQGGILVITEGVFGMTGAMGKVKEVCQLKEKYAFRLLVDDAHGFGTMGATGAGVGEAQGVQDQIDLYFSTFAKSMAGFGAFVAGDRKMMMFLRYNLRSQIFAKSLPMAMVVGILRRMELLRTQPELRENLWKVVDALQNGLREHGYNIGTTESPVTPVLLNGTIPESQNMVIDLRENHGIFCSVVVYPVVPKDMILLRLIPTAAHTLADVERTLVAFDNVSEKLRSGVYASAEVPMMASI